MTHQRKSRIPLSLGMPIYNGENFVEETLDSLLGQSFGDFELIICDNASTDRTEEICRSYASKDQRIKYYRNPENVGAGGNYRKTYHHAEGKYFKWCPHDDLCLPGYLAQTLEVLEKNPSFVLAHSYTQTIDGEGKLLREWPDRPDLAHDEPARRLRANLFKTETYHVFGVIRSEVLDKTPLLGDYASHDKPLLAELSLHGKFHEVPQFLFQEREHKARSIRVFDPGDLYTAVEWYDPKKKGKLTFPHWRLLQAFESALMRAPLSLKDRWACQKEILSWARQRRADLKKDLSRSSEHLPLIGKFIQNMRHKQGRVKWEQAEKTMAQELKRIVPKGEKLILIDEGRLKPELFNNWDTVPFLEKEGEYWGLPAGDEEFIQELNRQRSNGVRYLVLVNTSFWVPDHYQAWASYQPKHLQERFQSAYVQVFEFM